MVEWRSPGIIGTIQNAPLVTVQGTLAGTVQAVFVGGTVTISNMQGTVAVAGTVTTAVVNSPIVNLVPAQGVVIATTSGTLQGSSGTLHGFVASNPLAPTATSGTVPGTLIIFGFAGTLSTAKVPWVVTVPPNQYVQYNTPRGMPFTGSLVASIQGTLSVMFEL